LFIAIISYTINYKGTWMPITEGADSPEKERKFFFRIGYIARSI
jgi:hypothetical protein